MRTPQTRIHIMLPDELDDQIRVKVVARQVRSVSKFIAMAVREKLEREQQATK